MNRGTREGKRVGTREGARVVMRARMTQIHNKISEVGR